MSSTSTDTQPNDVRAEAGGPLHRTVGRVMRSIQRYRRWASGAAALLVLGACAHTPTSRQQMQRYDLGLPQINVSSATGKVAPSSVPPSASSAVFPTAAASVASPAFVLKVLTVSATTALDNDEIAYRLAYANPNQARHYSGSEWTATPAQLMTERLRGKLAQTARLLDGGDAEDVPLLKVELLDFSQRFDAPGRGQGVVSIRATLKTRDRLIAQRDFTATAPSPSADAAGGTSAIAQAADMVLDDLSSWVAQRAAASVAQ